MKRPLILFLFLVSAITVLSQDSIPFHRRWSFGFQGGVVGTHDIRKHYFPFKQKSGLGYVGGFVLQYKFAPRGTFCIEWDYLNERYYMINDLPWIYPDGTEEYRGTNRILWSYDYITMPISFKFDLNKKPTRWFFNLGMNSEYLLRSGYALNSKDVKYQMAKSGSTVHCGLITGFGVGIPIKGHTKFLIELRNNLNYGISDDFLNKGYLKDLSYRIAIDNLDLLLGFSF